MAHRTAARQNSVPSGGRTHQTKVSDAQALQQSTVQRAMQAPGSLSGGDILALQRSAGNQAVLRLMRERGHHIQPAAPVRAAAPPATGLSAVRSAHTIQRNNFKFLRGVDKNSEEFDRHYGVKFDSPDEQNTTQITIAGGKLYRSPFFRPAPESDEAGQKTDRPKEGIPVDTSASSTVHSRDGMEMYALSEQGALHMAAQALHERHHSSLVGGQAVAAAGEMEVEKGTLKLLTDSSGHYKPEHRHNFQILRLLAKNGVNLNSFMFKKDTGQGPSKRTEYKTAGSYMDDTEVRSQYWSHKAMYLLNNSNVEDATIEREIYGLQSIRSPVEMKQKYKKIVSKIRDTMAPHGEKWNPTDPEHTDQTSSPLKPTLHSSPTTGANPDLYPYPVDPKTDKMSPYPYADTFVGPTDSQDDESFE